MRTRSRYIFGAALAATAGLGVLPIATPAAHGATVAFFGFESLASNFSSTAAAWGGYVADSGTGTASALHASATTVYSSPAGNGTARAISSTAWAIGDYYQFTVPTSGFSNIMLSFDQTGSNTGPGIFKLQYSSDGSNFSDFGTYTLMNGTGTTGFAGTSVTATNLSHLFDLSAITALNNDASAIFRLVDNSTSPFNFQTNTTQTVAAAGTDRVDNVLIVGSAAVTPEPATLALIGVAGLGLLSRRRRQD